MESEPPSPTAITNASSHVYRLARRSGRAWRRGGAGDMPTLLGRAEDGAEAWGRQTRAGVERRQASAVDQDHGGTDVPEVGFPLQNANHQIDGELRLNRRLVGRRGDDGPALDTSIDSRAEIVRQHLGLRRDLTLAQHRHRGFCGDGRPDDVVEILVLVEGGSDQLGLLREPGVAEACLDDEYLRALHRGAEALIARRHPAGSL